MRFFNCICLAFITFCTEVMADGEVNNDYQPKTYADISQKAQENAMKYDGFKTFAGLCYSATSFKASVEGGSSNTQKDFNVFMFTFGLSGSKIFKQNFLAGVSLATDICSSKKKESGWDGLNADYNAIRGPVHSARGKLNGELKIPSINFELALQLAYIFKKLTSYAFLKLGASRIEGTYCYNAGGNEVGKVKAVGFVPLIGLGGGKNFNNKFGAVIEVNFPICKTIKKNTDFTEHKIKLGKKTIRLLGTYSAKLSF